MTLVEITRHELEKNIFSNKYGELDFYAYCNTPWHAIGIQSFVNNLSEKKQKLSGIVFLANQPGREAIVHPEDFNFNNNVEVQYFKNIDSYREDKKSYLKKLLFSKATISSTDDNHFYMLRPFRPDYKFGAEYQIETGKKCELVCLEEGVGTYKSNYEIFREKVKGSKKAGFIYALTCIFNSFLTRQYRLNITNFTLFRKKDRGLVLIEENAKLYLDTIKRSVVNQKIDTDTEFPEKFAMILTQPFEIKQDVECKEQINKTFIYIKNKLNDLGVKVYIKPHPRESREVIETYKNWGFDILPGNKPIEVYLEMIPRKPIAVIGTVSTALVTASALNDVKAISIINIITEEMDKNYQKAAEQFKKRYCNFVVFPSAQDSQFWIL